MRLGGGGCDMVGGVPTGNGPVLLDRLCSPDMEGLAWKGCIGGVPHWQWP